MAKGAKTRLAIVVSHPVQYYVPLYRRLAQREDLEIKVFYTWHGGEKPALDQGFKREFAWDIPLTEGYSFEVVPNIASRPGTHHFWGLRNPALIETICDWKPDAVHLTGYAYASHLRAMRYFHHKRIPILFRGDSHLLGQRMGIRWLIKRTLLSKVYRWPSTFLHVGKWNREYYQAFGVPENRLHWCPHSIEVARFAEPQDKLEQEAIAWRQQLGIEQTKFVLLFAGKFEKKKQPIQLMRAVLEEPDDRIVLVMVGDGELGGEVRHLSENAPSRFRVLPFQNQTRMPLVYRLGHVFLLPSAYDETWGLAVNEAMACGRPVLVSDKVGCAPDLVRLGVTGDVFPSGDWRAFRKSVRTFAQNPQVREAMGREAQAQAWNFDIPVTEKQVVKAIQAVLDAGSHFGNKRRMIGRSDGDDQKVETISGINKRGYYRRSAIISVISNVYLS